MERLSRRFYTCVFFVLTITFFLGFLTKTPFMMSFVKREPPCLCCNSRLTTETITPLEDNRTFIISPYHDPRGGNKHMVRILSIIHHKEVKDLYCFFCCSNKSLQVSKANINMHSDRFGYPYVTTDLLCAEPEDCHAEYLSVQTSSSRNVTEFPLFQIRNSVQTFTANFTVCISTMFGNYSNVLQFIQAMEMYQLLGAQKVVIYLNNCSSQVEKVLQYYITQGTVEVVPWPILQYFITGRSWHYSLDHRELGYYGQLATLNDCIYRNMYRSRFVLLIDIDEIILPFQHHTWDALMDELQQQYPDAGTFLFENHVFPQSVATDGNFSNISPKWKDIPGSNILQHVHREPSQVNFFNARKMIVDPRKAIQTSVHSVLREYGKSINVPMKTALLYHCRSQHRNLTRASLIEDKTIWRYNASLINNVNAVLNQITLT